MAEQTTIRELCQQHGLTQRALAERFGIPIRTVEDWYAGRRNPPPYVVNMVAILLQQNHDIREE